MNGPTPAFDEGAIVTVRVGSYARPGRIEKRRWQHQPSHPEAGYYIYEIGPLDVAGLESVQLSGVYQERHLSECDAITLLGALAYTQPVARTDLPVIDLPYTRVASEMGDA